MLLLVVVVVVPHPLLSISPYTTTITPQGKVLFCTGGVIFQSPGGRGGGMAWWAHSSNQRGEGGHEAAQQG